MLFPQKAFISFDLIDAAGILFFSHAFTLCHHIFETAVLNELGITWKEWFNNSEWIAPIKHCEANFSKPLLGGQSYDVEAVISQFGESSFTINYTLSREKVEFCSVKIVHVFCDKTSGKKTPIPTNMRIKLEK